MEVLISALDDEIAGICAARTLEQMGPSAKAAGPVLLELSTRDKISRELQDAVAKALQGIEVAADED